jgi:hypothetical protein
MDDIRPNVPVAPVRLFDQLRRHMRDGGYARQTARHTQARRGAMGVLSPLDGE